MRYSPERKEAVLRKMMPPHNRPISQLAKEERISEATLYKWRDVRFATTPMAGSSLCSDRQDFQPQVNGQHSLDLTPME